MLKSILVLFILSNALAVSSLEELTVETKQGLVRGYKNHSALVFEFYGIPYATAPTGKDKFKSPLPPRSWEGIMEATDASIICPQASGGASAVSLSYREDCLVLNVYKPDDSSRHPVFVHVHGGGYSLGYGASLAPGTLAENGVVGVTFNYRLGPHGFLCLHTESVPGNAGLRDQLAALRWVRDNIASFGGDPTRVTVGGYDAGAAAAELLALSPASKGLFHSIILESGSAVASWAITDTPLQTARVYGTFLGAPTVRNIETLADFYTSLTVNELFSQLTISDFEFRPCIDNARGGDSVIHEDPVRTLVKNAYVKLPTMTGYTDAEGLLFKSNRDLWLKEMNSNFSVYLPPLDYPTRKEKQRIADLVRKFYFGNAKIDNNQYAQFVRYLTDVSYAYPIISSARHHAENNATVYLYEFRHVDARQAYGVEGIGADHSAETAYVFNQNVMPEPAAMAPANVSDVDKWIRNKTTELWINFIKYGEPWSGHWYPMTRQNTNYLVIDEHMNNGTSPLKDRVQFWDNIYAQLPNPLTGACNTIRSYILMYALPILILLYTIAEY